MNIPNQRFATDAQGMTFSLKCDEPRVWLVVKAENRKPRVMEMLQGLPTLWSVRADLEPGEYRCRYYCGNDRNIVYHGPARVEGGIEAGMDTVVSVKSRNRRAIHGSPFEPD